MSKHNKKRKENKETVAPKKSWTDYRVYDEEVEQTIDVMEKRLHFQDLISDLTSKFIDLPASEVNRQIDDGLKQIVEFLGIDRSAFMTFSPEMKEFRLTHTYGAEGIAFGPGVLVAEALPWYSAKLQREEVFKLEYPDDLPEEASAEITYCQQIGLKSNLTIPISIGGSLICSISFTSFRNHRSWSDELIEQLRRVGEIFAHATYRRNADLKLQKQCEFEQLISNLSARITNLIPIDVDHEINQGLRILVEFFGADRSSLLQLSENEKEFIVTHIYAGKGVKWLAKIPMRKYYPWALNRILRGEIVSFTSVKELPAEAASDLKNMHILGLKSNITVPIQHDNVVKYALAVGAVNQERKWPEGIAPRMQLFGEIFINSLLRQKNSEMLQKREKELRYANKEITRLSDQLKHENIYLQEEIKAGHNFGEMIGHSEGLKYIFYKIKQVAPTNTIVLVLGETGTGKELVARSLHQFSSRKDRPLIKVDCCSLPANMIESELFGHEKGAYTGAHALRIGRFELADGATIFLDEIAELPPELQSKLLRVLEDREFERLGSSHTLKVDVRIIAATNRHLESEVENGNFREDLYYRLNIFPLTLPPLRERKEDISELTEAFVQRFSRQLGKQINTIPGEILNILQKYSWPGNIRELENTIERAVITTEGSVLQLMDNLKNVHTSMKTSIPGETLQERELNYILEVLEKTSWRIEGKNGAAIILGLHPDTLRSRMKKLGIQRPSSQSKVN